MDDTAATTASVAQYPSTLGTSPLVTAMAIGIMATIGINGAMIAAARPTKAIKTITTMIGITTGTATTVGAATTPDKHSMPKLFPDRVGTHRGGGVFVTSPMFLKGNKMNKDHIKGAVDQAKGSIKQAVGAASGDTKLKVEGTLEKAKGKLESAVGNAKDTIRRS